jgi:hypothetical protein
MRVATALYGLLYFGVGKLGNRHTHRGTQLFHLFQVIYPALLLLLGTYRLLAVMSSGPAAKEVPMEIFFFIPLIWLHFIPTTSLFVYCFIMLDP